MIRGYWKVSWRASKRAAISRSLVRKDKREYYQNTYIGDQDRKVAQI